MGKKITEEIIKEECIANGYIFIGIEGGYKNQSLKNIIISCNECGENVYTCWAKLRSSKPTAGLCKQCFYTTFNKLSIDEVASRLLEKGVKLISEKYEGETCGIDVMCSCGKIITTTYASIRNSGRNGRFKCSECAKEYSRNYFRTSFEDIGKYFKDNDCTLLSTEDDYLNIFTEFEFIATCGHIHISSFQSFKNSKHKMCLDCTKKINCGENAYNWKGGYDSDNIKFRKTYEFKKWHKDVLKRDDYTCQCCEIRGYKLNAHHLNGYNWDKENRTNVDNGITLCEDCHNEFHNTYGRGDNTKEQYEEWFLKKKKVKQ